MQKTAIISVSSIEWKVHPNLVFHKWPQVWNTKALAEPCEIVTHHTAPQLEPFVDLVLKTRFVL